MRMSFHFYNPTRIVFGSGTLNELGNQALPGKKALLLMSCGKSAKVSGAYDRTLEQLKKAGVEVAEFAKVMENPLKDMVMAFAKDNGCDFIVALGGGAVLDSATAISAMATNEGDLWDYVCGGTGKDKPLSRPGLPVVTITLTAGTAPAKKSWGRYMQERPRKSTAGALFPIRKLRKKSVLAIRCSILFSPLWTRN